VSVPRDAGWGPLRLGVAIQGHFEFRGARQFMVSRESVQRKQIGSSPVPFVFATEEKNTTTL